MECLVVIAIVNAIAVVVISSSIDITKQQQFSLAYDYLSIVRNENQDLARIISSRCA